MKDYSKLFMDIAHRTAQESNCVKYQVGAVIIKDNRIILQGYNGTISGFQNCSDKFTAEEMKDITIRTLHSSWSSAFEVHAEMNIICYAAKKGIPLEDTEMYCTMEPCNNCLKHAIQAGIKKIVFDKPFIDNANLNERKELLKFIQLEEIFKPSPDENI